MLYFFAWLFLISKAEESEALEAVTDDDAFMLLVEDRFVQCMDILREFRDVAGIFLNEDESRRRHGNAYGFKGKLKTCKGLVEASAIFLGHRYGFPMGIVWSEAAFVQDLLSAVSKRMGDVLYTASIDGDSVSDFHDACDDEGPTVVIVETTSGNVFGGYTDVSWDKSGSWKSSSTSFLFRLRPTMVHYGIKNGKENHAMYMHGGYSPTFGGGHDLYIASGALGNEKSFTNGKGYTTNHELNDGVKHFQVKDYIVLQAIAL